MIAGYCWPQSVLPGSRVALHCSCTDDRFDLRIVRQGSVSEIVHEATGIEGAERAIPEDAAANGCRWPASFEIEVSDAWRSGFYLVELRAKNGESSEAFFVVRSPDPGDVLLVLSTSTWSAYNDWGGRNFYDGGHRSSFQRPLPKGFLTRPDPLRLRSANMAKIENEEISRLAKDGYSFWLASAGWSGWEALFVAWAEGQGMHLDYAVSHDLEAVPGLLDDYRVYLSVGHDEYWSGGMRDAVEGFVDAGGCAAFFSGNTAFWQIRYEDECAAQVAYKMKPEADPVWGTDLQHHLTTMWSDPLVERPENELTGVSFTRGGYAHMDNAPDGSGGYTVWRPEHWAFRGLDLIAGDVIGSEHTVVGYECDGCELALENGRPVATGNDGTPESFEVLATAPAHLLATAERSPLLPAGIGELDWVAERIGGANSPENRERFAYGHAVMGSFSRGRGLVFTTGCTEWAVGLRDEAIATITRNVLAHFFDHERDSTRDERNDEELGVQR